MRRVLWSLNKPRRARKRDKSSSGCGNWSRRKMKSSHLRNNQHRHCCCIAAFVSPNDSVSWESETLTTSEGRLSRMSLTCKLRPATYREETQRMKPPLKDPRKKKNQTDPDEEEPNNPARIAEKCNQSRGEPTQQALKGETKQTQMENSERNGIKAEESLH